jgi:hypothetical protein
MSLAIPRNAGHGPAGHMIERRGGRSRVTRRGEAGTIMRDWKLPRRGRCRCGAVEITVTAPPLITMACHCTGCQRMSASVFSLSVAIPGEGFAVTKGEPVLGGLRQGTRHYFCPSCMSWMFTRPEGFDAFVNLRTTMLDVTDDLAPFVETMTAEKLAWATTPARHSYPGFPPFEAYEELVAAFAEASGEAG